MSSCYKCGFELDPDSHYGRQDTCPGCHTDTRICYHCLHYDSTCYNECAEPIAERVVDKGKSNFCDYFSPGSQKSKLTSQKELALKAAEALFKKK